MSSQQSRLPGSDFFVNLSFSTGATAWPLLDDPIGSPDDDSTYCFTTNNQRQAQCFPTSAFSITSSSINFLRTTYRRKQNGAGSGTTSQARLRVNSTAYGSSFAADGTSYADRDVDWLTNPNTGSAWTEADIEGTGSNPFQAWGAFNDDTTEPGEEWRLTQIIVTVDYEEPTTSGWYSIYPDAMEGGDTHLVPSLFYTPFRPPSPDLAWRPPYYPQDLTPIDETAGIPSYFSYPFRPAAVPLSWSPRYEDDLTPPDRTAEVQSFIKVPFRPAAPPLSWLSRFADAIDHPDRISEMPVFFLVRTVAPTVPPLSWLAKFDDIVPESPERPWLVGGPAYTPFRPPAPPLSWAPRFQDLPDEWLIPDAPSLFWSGFTPAVVAVPVGWRPLYPDEIARPGDGGAELVPVLVWTPFRPPAPPLAWAPRFEDQFLIGGPDVSEIPFGSFSPPFRSPAPPLSWQPIYESFFPGLALEAWEVPFTSWPEADPGGFGDPIVLWLWKRTS